MSKVIRKMNHILIKRGKKKTPSKHLLSREQRIDWIISLLETKNITIPYLKSMTELFGYTPDFICVPMKFIVTTKKLSKTVKRLYHGKGYSVVFINCYQPNREYILFHKLLKRVRHFIKLNNCEVLYNKNLCQVCGENPKVTIIRFTYRDVRICRDCLRDAK